GPKKGFQIKGEAHAVGTSAAGKQFGDSSIKVKAVQATLGILADRAGENPPFGIGNDVVETIHAVVGEGAEDREAAWSKLRRGRLARIAVPLTPALAPRRGGAARLPWIRWRTIFHPLLGERAGVRGTATFVSLLW